MGPALACALQDLRPPFGWQLQHLFIHQAEDRTKTLQSSPPSPDTFAVGRRMQDRTSRIEDGLPLPRGRLEQSTGFLALDFAHTILSLSQRMSNTFHERKTRIPVYKQAKPNHPLWGAIIDGEEKKEHSTLSPSVDN